MAEKFFLFKRKDPSLSGGSVFSDNGKGISVISIPSKNLAYMAASKGNITMYFNDSAPFEENRLTLDGESFEKTSVTVSCEIGGESNLMEEIINFINRETVKSIMKFDATGFENTFGPKTSKPSIDAKVRARPVERGLVGTESTTVGLDADALVGATGAIDTQIDFIKPNNKPVFDVGGEQISVLVTDGNSVTSGLSNRGTETGYQSFTYTNIICKESPSVCKTKTLGFDTTESLKIQDIAPIVSITESNVDQGLDRNASSFVIVTRGSSNISNDVALPRFAVSKSATASTVDSVDVTYGGSGIKVDDVIRVYISDDDDGYVEFTVTSDLLGGGSASRSGLFFDNFIYQNYTLDTPQPYANHTIYMVLVRPNGALLNPVYSNKPDTSSPPDDFTYCMGPFPVDSKGDEFQFNYNENGDIFSKVKSGITKSNEPISNFYKTGSRAENSEDNLIVLVIRRDPEKNITVYDKFGEIIAEKPASDSTSGDFFFSRIGMVVPFEQSKPQLRIARFGVVAKSLDDFVCRSIATQLYNKYKA